MRMLETVSCLITKFSKSNPAKNSCLKHSILVIIFSDDIPYCSPNIALSMVSVLFL